MGDAPPEMTDDPNLRANGVDRHRLLEDTDLEGDQDVTAGQIQALLEAEGSALASFSEGGRTAAQWIVQESTKQGISPVYMVARIETESGLIRSGTLGNLLSATGCACPDGQACDPSVAEFGLQVRCAAELARSYFEDIDAFNWTISGWGVGVGKSTLDPCWVVPENRATAALYTYTPWVGAYARGCGTSQWGGSSLVAVLVKEFQAALPTGPIDDGGEDGEDCAFGDGFYCGGNGVAGDPSTLYQCQGGAPTAVETCAAGCYKAPPGENDACVAETQTCSFGNGLYCGGNGVDGNVDTLYSCQDGVVSVQEDCANGCDAKEAGFDDACL